MQRERYKSWSDIRKRAEDLLCDALRGRIAYFFTNYRDVHNVYGRAAIRLSGKELVCFSWIEQRRQEKAISELPVTAVTEFSSPQEERSYVYEKLKPGWDLNCTYCESDFIMAVQRFFHLSIEAALSDEDYIIRILAILDRRTGKRTLLRIKASGEYLAYPKWVRDFYQLRFDAESI
jgi:hypothetical protein